LRAVSDSWIDGEPLIEGMLADLAQIVNSLVNGFAVAFLEVGGVATRETGPGDFGTDIGLSIVSVKLSLGRFRPARVEVWTRPFWAIFSKYFEAGRRYKSRFPFSNSAKFLGWPLREF
jgi:hypothetical protein